MVFKTPFGIQYQNVEVKIGDKIAQLVLEKISDVNECKWNNSNEVNSNEVNSNEVPKLSRNDCGFGSSGI